MIPSDREWIGLAWAQLWQVTALVVAVGLAVRLGCRRRPHLAYVLWMLVLLKCLTPPLWSSPAGLFSWAQARAEEPATAIRSDQLPESIGSVVLPVTPSSVELLETSPREEAASPVAAVAASQVSDEAPPEAGHGWRLPLFGTDWKSILLAPARALLAVWLAGAVVLAAVVMGRWWRFCRVLRATASPADAAVEALAVKLARRLGLRRRFRVWATTEPVGPAVFGLLRPTLVLPQAVLESKSPQELAPILAHELIHIRRGDPLWGTLQIVVEVLWWFHPLVWWANGETCRQRERCCDEEAVVGLECTPAAYARCLLDVLESERAWRPVPALPGVRSLEVTTRRLEHIMIHATKFHRRTPGWCWGVLVALAALLLPGKGLVLDNAAAVGDEPAEPTASTAETDEEQSSGEKAATGQTLNAQGKGGGDSLAVPGPTRVSERSTAGGLQWLARHQLPDGKWSFHSAPSSCKCSGAGSAHCDVAATALTLLSFLGAGQTHETHGPFQTHVQAGIAWLMLHRDATSGDLAKGSPQHMYAHGIAALALCEAYGMTKDPKLREAAVQALRFIEAAQDKATGAWGNEPGDAGDTAVTVWQVMALKSGQLAGLDVNSRGLENVRKWLASVQSGEHHGLFQRGPHDSKGVTPAMTAAGMLCHQYLGMAHNDPAMLESQQYLMENLPDADRERDDYYWWYATMAMHNLVSPQWDTWNRAMRKTLVQTQVNDKGSCANGSWDPDKPTTDASVSEGGRLMATNLSVLALEVYYRYLSLSKLNLLAASAKASAISGEASPGKTVVVGEVLDERGKPVAGAQVAVVGRPKRADWDTEMDFQTLGLGKSDAQGRYRLAVTPFSSAAYRRVNVVALANGHALGWQPVGLDVPEPRIVVRLPDEELLRGRVVDAKGFPAAGAKICVRGVAAKGPEQFRYDMALWDPVKMPAVWPQPATTDGEGRFTLHGVNTSVGALVQVVDDRFARWHFEIGRPGSGTSAAETRAKHPYLAIGGDFVPQASPADEVTLAPPPSQIIEGQVRYEDTKKPAAHARVSVYAKEHEMGSMIGQFTRADDQGRFRLNPFSGRFFDVAAYPPAGEPYLIRQKTFTWPDSTTVYRMEIAVPRGVLVRGKITEGPSGKPVADAKIQYEPRDGNPNVKKEILTRWQGMVANGDDGWFQIAVLPGKGTLIVQGPPDYVLDVFGDRQISSGLRGGRRYYAHAMIPLDLDPQATPEVRATLKRGVTVRARIVGPDDKPVSEALVTSSLLISPFTGQWRGGSPLVVRGGEFDLHGVDPEKPAPVYILDPRDQWGAKREISGRTAGEPLVVELLPCGSAEVRFVDAGGKPVVGRRTDPEIVFTPGPSMFVSAVALKAMGRGEFVADEDGNANFDRMHYWGGIRTDKDGRCVLPALIPGAAYRLCFESPSGENQVLDFTAESGKTLKLPDVVVKKPADGRAG